jgi:hypothetical protein
MNSLAGITLILDLVGMRSVAGMAGIDWIR